MAIASSVAAVGDDDWEWYVILTLWSPLQVIRLLEDSSEQATRLRKTLHSDLLSDSERRQMICDEVRRMLDAYVDKELELTRQRDLEKHLAGCPSCQAAAEEINNFSSLIRMNILVYMAPDELKAKIQASF